MTPTTERGALTLGHVLDAAGVSLSDAVALRHTFTADGLATTADLTPPAVLAYTRRQGVGNKLGPVPPRLWLVFMADGGRRSRLLDVYANAGESVHERADGLRFFDLAHTEVLSELVGRLVVEWSRDAVNWAESAQAAAALPGHRDR